MKVDEFDEEDKEGIEKKFYRKNPVGLLGAFKYFNSCVLCYTGLVMWGFLAYEFAQSRILSKQVNELQGKMKNLYQKVNEMNNNNTSEKK